jgi:hypothetical protein
MAPQDERIQLRYALNLEKNDPKKRKNELENMPALDDRAHAHSTR